MATGDNVLLNAQIVDKSENIIQQKNINTTYNQEIIVEFQNVPVSTTNIAVKIQILKDDKTVFEGKSNYFVMNYSDVYVNVLLKSVSETFEISEIPEMVFVKGATINGADIPGIDSTPSVEYKGVFISGRTVTLSDFYMSKYEITQAQYKAVMEGQTVTVSGEEKTLVVIKQSYNTFFQKFFQNSPKYS